MDLSNIGAFHLNDLRSGGSPLSGSAAPSASGDFSQMLQRMSLSQSSLDANSRRAVPDDIDRNSELFQLVLELETFLIQNVLSSMRNTIQRSEFIDQGFAGQIFEDMLFDEHARSLTRNAGLGLAEQAYRQLRNMGG